MSYNPRRAHIAYYVALLLMVGHQWTWLPWLSSNELALSLVVASVASCDVTYEGLTENLSLAYRLTTCQSRGKMYPFYPPL